MSAIRIKRRAEATLGEEYGCGFWRILPWEGSGSSDEGMALAVVEPLGLTTPHSHDEVETFVVMRGEGVAWVDGESAAVAAGDVVAVASGQHHHFANSSAREPLEVLCLWARPAGGGRS